MEESGNMDEPIKKKRGNPNFAKGKKNEYYDKDKKMAETVEEIKEPGKTETPSSEPTPAQEPVNNAPKVEFNMDIFSDVMPDDILPLDDEVKTKDYAKLNEGLGNGANPNASGSPSTSGGGGGSIASGTGLSTEGKSLEEMRSEAEQFVDFTLRAYDKAHDLARGLAKVKEEKLAVEHEEGKINLNHTFPLKGNPSIGQLVSKYNESIDETIVVEDKFKTDITPPMVRIAMKHKLGMSDEFRVISLIAEDAITKVSILIGLKSALNQILDMSREQVKASRQKQQAPPPPPKDNGYTEFVEEPTNDWRDAPSS